MSHQFLRISGKRFHSNEQVEKRTNAYFEDFDASNIVPVAKCWRNERCRGGYIEELSHITCSKRFSHSRPITCKIIVKFEGFIKILEQHFSNKILAK